MPAARPHVDPHPEPERTPASPARDAPPPRLPYRLLQAFLWLGTLTLVFYLLVIGRTLIIPLVLAFFAWYLINTLNKLTRSIRVGNWRPPRWLAFTLSAMLVVGVLLGLALLILDNVNEVQRKAFDYRERIVQISADVQAWLPEDLAASVKDLFTDSDAEEGEATDAAAGPGPGREGDTADEDPTIAATTRDPMAAEDDTGSFAQRLGRIDFTGVLQDMAATLGSFAASVAMVLAYLFFIFLEQRFFEAKLRMLVKDENRRRDIKGIIAEIDRDIRSYIGVKTLVSALTAALSYVIMKIAGLDFAEFWAVLLFVFNYIPNVGSLIATALPAGLALVQLDFTWFLVVTIGITGVQLAMANLVEPNLMGKSLNQSPLVVILSLVLWGSLWGVAGMFLCVPITVVVMIVLSHFPQTRWVPVLLSLDGRVRGDPEVRAEEGVGEVALPSPETAS